MPTGGKSHDSDSDEELLAAAGAYDKQFATASSAQMAAGGGVGLASWLSGPPPSVRHPNGAVSLPPDAPDSVVESVPTGCTSHDCDSDEDLLAAAEVYEKQSATASAHMPAGVGVGPGTQPSGPPPFVRPVVSPVAGSSGAPGVSHQLSPAVSTCGPGVPTVARPAQKALPDPKRPRVGAPLPTTATRLLDFQQAIRHPPELFAGLDYSSVVVRAAPPAAQSAHHVVRPYQGLSAQPREFLVLFGDQWVDAILTRLRDQQLAESLRRLPRVLLEGVLQPFRFGQMSFEEPVLDEYLRNLLRTWPAFYSDMTCLVAGKAGGVQIVYVGVVHLSTGHGSALGCAECAVKFLQGALSQWHVLPVLCSAQHLRVPWKGWENSGGKIQMAHLWKPAGHAAPPFTHHLLKWQPHGAAEVARRCRAECLNGARSGRMLVLLLADLLAFDVEAAIEAPNGSPNRTPLLQLKDWQAEFEQVIGANCIVKVSADTRKHSVVTKTWLGQNLAPTYEINADVFTGVNRPATICASPCASDFGGAGGTVEDLTRGTRQRFLIPPVDSVEGFAGATLRDGSIWSPQGRSRQFVLALTHEWPTVLRELSKLTDPPDTQTQGLVDIHKCAWQPSGAIRYAGPAYFLHFLSWADSPYADILKHHSCAGKIYVWNGHQAPEIVPDVGYGDAAWTALCGDVVLCRPCSAVVEALAGAWERRSMADVIARHTAAKIVHLCLQIQSADCRM